MEEVAGPAVEIKRRKVIPKALGKYDETKDKIRFAEWRKKMKSEQEELWSFLPKWKTIKGTKKEKPGKIIKETCRFLDYLTDHCLEWRCLPRIHEVREEILNLYHLLNNNVSTTKHDVLALISKRHAEIDNRLTKEVADATQRGIRQEILKVRDPAITKIPVYYTT